MKKYTPSVKENNALVSDAIQRINAFAYKMERGRHNKELNTNAVAHAVQRIVAEYTTLQNTVGLGKEDIYSRYQDVLEKLKKLEELSEQGLTNRFEAGADELCYSIGLWKDVLDGVVTDYELDNSEEGLFGTHKKIEAKLTEMAEMKQEFLMHEKRLGLEIVQLEKDIAELDELIMEEENERKINELFRKVSASKAKVDMLNARCTNYNVCSQLIDMIETNIRELIVAGKYASSELSKVKALLNMDKIRAVVSQPDKAIAILKAMQKDTDMLKERMSAIDSSVFGKSQSETSVSAEATQYKRALLEKKMQKEQAKRVIDELDVAGKKAEVKVEE